MSNSLVSIRDLHKVYHRGGERIDVLQGVNLEIPSGDFLALMGPSGSGKTTLLNLIGGLDTPSEGSIDVGGDRIDNMSGGKLSAWRARHIGFVFQLYNLLPVLTAARNVELPLLLTKLGKADRRKRVQVALSVVGLGGAREPLSAAAVGRAGTARRHRPRDRHRSDPAAVRRADRRPRSQVRRRDPRSAAGAQSRSRQDDRHGDARSARRGARQADAAPRKGAARDGGGGMKFLPLIWRNLTAPEDPHDLHDRSRSSSPSCCSAC